MSINSTSTPAQVLAQYDNNLSWRSDQAQAELVLESIDWLLVHRPTAQALGGRSLSFEGLSQLKKDIESRWGLATARANGRSRANRVDFREPQGVD